MPTSIEIASRRIRVCRHEQGRITHLESFPIPEGADPILALTEAPLPAGIGRVRVVLHHGDLLLKSMVQPPCPPDRLKRIVDFELRAQFGEEMDAMASWHLVRTGGDSDDMRVLVMVAKRMLIQDLRRALAKHGAKLDGVIPPGIGLYHAWLGQTDAVAREGDAALLDVGGSAIHTVLVRHGELLFLRSNSPGQDELVKGVAELREIDAGDARDLLRRLGKYPPLDLAELVKRNAQSLAASVTANTRFACAQLRLDSFKPATIWLSGAGAQTPGFLEALATRAGVPVRIVNPFVGAVAGIAGEQLDEMAELPSPWCPAIGASRATRPELDALEPVREEKRRFWLTSGALRVAAAAVVALAVLALVRQHFAASYLGGVEEELGGANGLVTAAEKKIAERDRLLRRKQELAARMRFVAEQRRPARIAVEALNAIGHSIDPAETRVTLSRYRVDKVGDATRVALQGAAEPGGGRSYDQVLESFRANLLHDYPVFESRVDEGDVKFEDGLMLFDWNLTIPDSAEAATPSSGDNGGTAPERGRGLGS